MKPEIRNWKLALLAGILISILSCQSGAQENRGQGPGARDQEIESSGHLAIGRSLGLGFANAHLPSPIPHRFWDAHNVALIAAGAGLRAADVVSTRAVLRRGGEEKLLPERLVRNTPAFAAYSAGAVGVTTGMMYLAHRTRHHRWERAIGWIHAGFMAGLVTNNVYWIAQR